MATGIEASSGFRHDAKGHGNTRGASAIIGTGVMTQEESGTNHDCGGWGHQRIQVTSANWVGCANKIVVVECEDDACVTSARRMASRDVRSI